MSENFEMRGDKKYCLNCKDSYAKSVSINTLKNHFEKFHKNQPSITLSAANLRKKEANEQLSSNLAEGFALLNWPLQHVNSKAFNSIVESLRDSSARMPHRSVLRSKTLCVAKQYEQK